jgi:serine protease AprX
MNREQIEELFYGKPEQQRRFTQDFPILPDVWIEYGKAPQSRFDLLLTPHYESDASTLALLLRERLKIERELDGGKRWKREHQGSQPARVLFNESVVLATLSFWELLRAAMPLTDWWSRVVKPIVEGWSIAALTTLAHKIKGYQPGSTKSVAGADPKLVQRLIKIVGCIECDRHQQETSKEMLAKPAPTDTEIKFFARVFEGLSDPGAGGGKLWSISLNRSASTTIWRSRLTVKADAAARLFDTKTYGIRWAVFDTGIDARHPAFQRRDAADHILPAVAGSGDSFNSRVVRTYNFLPIKDLLDPDTPMPFQGTAAARDKKKLRILREDLLRSLQRGRSIDWDLLEPLLRVPHDKDYRPPGFDSHGTHVAGILAANWPDAPLKEPLRGMCPELELYDIRVLPDDPRDTSDEFTIIAALQFIRHLNAHKDLMMVHGVNLSLSVPHDVANYACGRTPVCEECERVVNNGVVVVTAAGNRGFNKLRNSEGGALGDYRYISITDPGNADGVITVGSTHRLMPHNYGVSYFSSRGPTGDGRTKPDLVAPGERIDSCSLNNYYETMDGTSMAAPHVSGAAALLIARHRELVGQPRRVKEILCRSATDLGREPRFQGAGMLDVLRALQSI